MHALRLHKATVPGRDKARQARRLQQATRQRGARSSILQGLRSFLTADSFMYGPLMEAPPVVHISSEDSEPRTPEKEQSDGGLDDGSTRDDSNGAEENEENPNEENGKKVDNGHDERAIGMYQGSRASKTIVSVQRTSARMTARTVVPPPPHDGSRTPSSTGRVMKPSRNGT